MKLHFHRPTIRLFAVLCVSVTSVFVMVMHYRMIEILSSPDWCGKALQAGRISNEHFGGLTACTNIFILQLKSVAVNSYIEGGIIALCLGVLVIIVIAQSKADITLPGVIGGGSIHVEKQTGEAKGAMDVAGAAVDKATEIASTPPGDGNA